jgi:hypothetical protein
MSRREFVLTRDLALVCLGLGLTAGMARAQAISVQLNTRGEAWVRRDAAIELVVQPMPAASEGRLAIVLGTTDMTDLFRATPTGLAYRPELIPLPPGESELVVYLVSPLGVWTEIARLPLRVLRAGGFETITVTPRVDVLLKGQVAEGHRPDSNRPPRSTFQDLGLQIDFQGALTRSGLRFEPRVNVVGSSYENEALRFGELGSDAPRADLSSYQLRLSRGNGFAALGHLMWGDQKQLIYQFQSRGLQLHLPLGGRADVTFSALNGTQIVGWDNISGIEEADHRLLVGDLGFELVRRPGGLRFDGYWLDGSLLPRSGFSQVFVSDREDSRGLGFRLAASTPNQRLRLETGWARSRFTNPPDPFLAQGLSLVPVEPETRDARYAELTLGMLQRTLPKAGPASLNLTLRHGHIEPQYRSIGALLQADRDDNTAELQALVGAASAQATYTSGHDNLDDIASIITTQTRRATLNLMLPFGPLVSPAAPRAWLPSLTYTLDRTHQYGDSVPPNGDFTAPFVPDQASLNQLASLDWTAGRWRFGLRLGGSNQDNRQPGRERADLDVDTRGVALGVAPAVGLDLSLEAARELSHNREFGQETETRRYGLNASWRSPKAWSVTALVSRSESDDDPRTRTQESWGGDGQIAWRFERKHGERHGTSGQIFLRYLAQSNLSRDALFGGVDQSNWSLSSGLSVSLF